jgi:galactokinase/mevalonate kinase-like predicted kinase
MRPIELRNEMVDRVVSELRRRRNGGSRRSHDPVGEVVVTAPVRLDLGMAGPADCAPYCLRAVASTVNASVLIGGAGVEVVVRPAHGERSSWTAGGRCESVSSLCELEAEPLRRTREIAATVALELLGLDAPDDLLCVLGRGTTVRLRSVLPIGTGLGVSSVVAGAFVLAVTRAVGVTLSYAEVALAVLLAELRAGGIGGWEDTTALLGAWKTACTEPSQPLVPAWKTLDLAPAVEEELASSLKLLWTGRRAETAGGAYDTVPERLGRRHQATEEAVDRLHVLNEQLAGDLRAGTCRGVPGVMRSQWRAWVEMTGGEWYHDGVRRFVEGVEAMGGAARFAGAGGGGVMLVWAPPEIRGAVEDVVVSSGPEMHWLPWATSCGVFPAEEAEEHE